MNNIKVKDLSFAYSKKIPFISGLNLEIETGKIYGLLGKNGAGKTTLLKLIAGLIFPQSGDIHIGDYSVKDRNPNFVKDIFYLAEEFYLPSISCSKYVSIYSVFYPNFSEEEFNTYIKEFEIPLHNKLDKMSYGQKKKFLIAFGIASNTKLFIMDEPTNGLDIPSKSLYRKILSSTIKEDRAYVISTHQITDVELLLDNVIVLDDAKIKLNLGIAALNDKLYFSKTNNNEEGEVLYIEDQTLQVKKICSNPNRRDSIINLELLFNAIVSDNESIINHLTNTKNYE